MSAWMITRHGRDHYLSGHEIQTNIPDIDDIACSLAQINRFTGHATRPYCVAEHSLLTAELARLDGKSAVIQMACLMHDAHEAITGDMSSPAKNVVSLAWADFEHRHADQVRRYFGLLTAFATHQQLVNHYDLVALATERAQLTTYRVGINRPWPVLDEPGRVVPPDSRTNLNSIARTNARWNEWRDGFLSRFHELRRAVDAASQALISATHHPV